MYTFSVTGLLTWIWRFSSFLAAPFLLFLFYLLFSHQIVPIDAPLHKKNSLFPSTSSSSFRLIDLFEVEGRLTFLGKSVRPDLEETPWIFEIDGKTFAVKENSPLYIHPTCGNKYLFHFEESDKESPFFLTIESNKLTLSLGAEKKIFSPVKKEKTSSFTESIHLLPPDLLLLLINPSHSPSYRISLGDKIVSCENGTLISLENGSIIDRPPVPSTALLRFSLLNKESALIEKWEPYGRETFKETVRLSKLKPQENIHSLITPLRRRSLTNVECQIGSSKTLLKKGDWLIPHKGRLTHLNCHKEQLKWLSNNPTGEVFVSLGAVKSGNKWSVLLHHYDRFHGSYTEVHLPINTHHKK